MIVYQFTREHKEILSKAAKARIDIHNIKRDLEICDEFVRLKKYKVGERYKILGEKFHLSADRVKKIVLKSKQTVR